MSETKVIRGIVSDRVRAVLDQERRERELYAMETAGISGIRNCLNPACGELFAVTRADRRVCCNRCGNAIRQREKRAVAKMSDTKWRPPLNGLSEAGLEVIQRIAEEKREIRELFEKRGSTPPHSVGRPRKKRDER